MSLHSIVLSLMITVGGPTTIDAYPTFLLEGQVVTYLPNSENITGMSLPHFIIVHPTNQSPAHPTRRELLGHEYLHIRQYEALGPAFWAGYLAGGGVGFEDYLGDGSMWAPERGERRCPMFRLKFSEEASQFSFMPCYEIFRING